MILKQRNGENMAKIQMFNPSNKLIGTYDTDDKTYYRIVNKQQQFLHPKYAGMLAISRTILKKLISLGCERFCFTLTEWEKIPFNAIISVKNFTENMEELHFKGKINSDKQYGCRLFHWTRLYNTQKQLKEVL